MIQSRLDAAGELHGAGASDRGLIAVVGDAAGLCAAIRDGARLGIPAGADDDGWLICAGKQFHNFPALLLT